MALGHEPRKSLSDRWLVWLESNRHHYHSNFTPERFRNSVHTAVFSVLSEIARESDIEFEAKGNSENKLKDLSGRLYGFSFDKLEESMKPVMQEQNDLYRNYKTLRDQRSQEDWATSWDHLKVFLFRTATALMIAGVVLLTGYLSQRYGIPVPMVRMTPGAT